MTRWADVPHGSIVRGADGYEWEIVALGADGSVTMEREGRAPVTGKPSQSAEVEVISYSRDMVANAVRTLRSVFDVTVLECAWCRGDDTEECVCDEHCGAVGCVNFPKRVTT